LSSWLWAILLSPAAPTLQQPGCIESMQRRVWCDGQGSW
jgi:hypothetical protein